jgi:alpha-beta hydrolase superfamily lysophospholipase
MLFLVQNGFRVVAHDRRGHGRSSQASSRNDMDGYAEDLARSQGRHTRKLLHLIPTWNTSCCIISEVVLLLA